MKTRWNNPLTRLAAGAPWVALLLLTTPILIRGQEAPASPPHVEAPCDLRPAFSNWGLALRLQGERGTCSVFTFTGALEYALAHRQQQGTVLSVEFLNWASNKAVGSDQDGGFFSDLWAGFAAYGICSDTNLPYKPAFDPKLRPSETVLEEAKKRTLLGLKTNWIKLWDVKTGLTPAQLTQIKSTLTNGWPVCGGFRWPKSPHWQNEVLQMAAPEDVFDGHSVLLVGFKEDSSQPGGGVFYIRNSGGGVHESALPYEYVRTYMNDALWIDHP